ncbi:MAG TPA: polyprenyl synthetase family protein, partial [Candidatus Binatia bacterium]|nr:polyprenyl synthetase family protein [Candidatus Binatia bacterium]
MTSPTPEQVDDINALIKERGQTVVERFRETLTLNITDTKLLAALNYVTGYWSDYFRPALCSFSCEAVGGNSNNAVCIGMMLTSIDAGVSIHDDILDRTTKKRFRRTILGKFGLDYALLVGDLLIVKGWSMIGEMIKTSEDPSLIRKLTETYSNSLIEMCEAQFFEIECRKNLSSDPNTFIEALCKGNAGIKACMELGAILSGGTETEIHALSNVGKNIALLFALKDELRDTLNLEGYLVHRLKFESVPLPVLLAAKSSSKRRLQLESIIKKNIFKNSDIEEILSLCI